MNDRKFGKWGALVALLAIMLGVWGTARADSVYTSYANGSIAANTSILTAAITPGGRTAQIEVTVGLTSTNSVLNVIMEDNAGGTNRTFALNGGTALTAGNLYSFAFDVSPNFDYNFQPGTTTNVTLTAREVKNAR